MPEAGFVRHFIACNRHDPTKFVPFYIGNRQLGAVSKELAALMPAEMDFFVPNKNGIALAPHLDNFSARSDALAAAAGWLCARRNRALRDEMYPIVENWGDTPLAQIDRTAVPWFGIKAFGIHVNGFVRKPDGIHLWIGERAMDRLVDPGKLDNMIAGGQPIGLTLEDNLCKEAGEEAGITPVLARTAKAVSSIGYQVERMGGLRNDVLFIYDLEVPEAIIPRNTDREVARFHLMPLAEVAATVHDTDLFKFNCNLVVIDFLVRHGFLGRDDKEYAEIIDCLTAK